MADAGPPKLAFMVAGAQKGGTTALHAYLRGHPGLCLSDPKEAHFFDTEAHFAGPAVDYAPLHAHFRPRPGQLLGDATPITMYWADAPRRLWEYNPAAKVVCVLRDPVDRAYSHWNMERAARRDDLPFDDALRLEGDRCRAARPLQHRLYSYTDRGFYAEQVRRLWRYFPPAQTLFLRHEDLRRRPQPELDRVFDFLGVDRVRVEPRVEHAIDYPAPMSAAARAYLRGVFEWDVREVERLLGWDLRGWLAAPAGRAVVPLRITSWRECA